MHVHGVLPGKAPAVLPGANYTWNWPVPSRSGPGRGDFSSLIYPYHSNIKGGKDVNAGLVGAIVVTGKGMARPDGHPMDVDREYILWYEVFDESSSLYYTSNLNTYLPQQVNNTALLTSVPFKGSLLRASINGFSYGSIPVLTMRVGERVRWYSIGLGGVGCTTGSLLFENQVHKIFLSGRPQVDFTTVSTFIKYFMNNYISG